MRKKSNNALSEYGQLSQKSSAAKVSNQLKSKISNLVNTLENEKS